MDIVFGFCEPPFMPINGMEDEMGTAKITEAGMTLLRRFVELEAAGRLALYYGSHGSKMLGMRFSPGDGASKAAAAKLHREGYAKLHWAGQRGVRVLFITDKGRAAVAEASFASSPKFLNPEYVASFAAELPDGERDMRFTTEEAYEASDCGEPIMLSQAATFRIMRRVDRSLMAALPENERAVFRQLLADLPKAVSPEAA